MKQKRKVYHVYFKGIARHYYFGSIAAIYDLFSEKELGVSSKILYYDHDIENVAYQNDNVIIRFGYLIAKEGGRGKKL